MAGSRDERRQRGDEQERRSSHRHARIAPVALGPNQPGARPYRGGAGIARFRRTPSGAASADEWTPEDFVASTTEVFAGGGVGLTTLPNGVVLRDDLALAPAAYLGDQHLAAFGADARLLVKLLDTRERLFVHYHPSTAFARQRLAHASGKTEAWIIVATDPPAFAYLGFHRDVGEDELLDWFERQDVTAMLAAMNRVELAPGDTLYVPAGLPHSIGPGVTLVELQQPVDLSIIVEYDGFPGLDAASSLLGLDARTAFSDLDRSTVTAERLARLSSSRPVRTESDAAVTPLFPAEADEYFRADLIEVDAEVTLDAGFSVLVVLEGEGELGWDGRAVRIVAGQTLLVPHAAGRIGLRGEVSVLRCRPPAARL